MLRHTIRAEKDNPSTLRQLLMLNLKSSLLFVAVFGVVLVAGGLICYGMHALGVWIVSALPFPLACISIFVIAFACIFTTCWFANRKQYHAETL